MATLQMNRAVNELKRIIAVRAQQDLPDAELVGRFVSGNDEAAFEVLVRRHGPMVLSLCRRVLRDQTDAEDAFQATFLVLFQKAQMIRPRGAVGNWLYGVARNTALKARAMNQRRQHKERLAAQSRRAAQPEANSRETLAILDEELARLSDKYRAIIILCDLQGRTLRDAAGELGCPLGTAAARLARGRQRLARQLASRGLAVASAAETLTLTQGAATGAVPASLIRATVLAGRSIIAASALSTKLAEGVLKTMLLSKLLSKPKVLTLLLVMALAAGGGTVALVSDKEPAAGPFASRITGNWTWLDKLPNADEVTKERLKKCINSAERNFAALRKAAGEFDLVRELGITAPSGATKFLKHCYRGKVYWHDGAVRYDFEGDRPSITFLPIGKPLEHKGDLHGNALLQQQLGDDIEAGKGVYSVIRSKEMTAWIEDHALYGLFLRVESPPKSLQAWKFQFPFCLTHLDPWVHHAPMLRDGPKELRQFWEACHSITSTEENGKVVFMFLRADNTAWVELICDKSADYLPRSVRAGELRKGEAVVLIATAHEWMRASDLWYPAHYVATSYYGAERKPLKDYDLRFSRLTVNDAADVPETVFTLSDMAMPDGYGGLDMRQKPPTQLIRANGIVRPTRPPEALKMQPAPQARVVAKTSAAKRELKEAYLALLEEYETAQRAVGEKVATAQTLQEQHQRLHELAQTESSFAGRFLEAAIQDLKDPLAVDALSGLLVNRFTPKESERAAELLIQEHLQSDNLLPLYRQLARPSAQPLALSLAVEKLLRAALARAPSKEARGTARLALALHLNWRADALDELQGPEANPVLLRAVQGLERGKLGCAGALRQEAAKHFDMVVEQFAAASGDQGLLRELARDELFKLRELAVGKSVPEIDGTDVDGGRFKLSDYRGKVVVLTFSGNWCGPCRAMYPQERELVDRWKGKSFALLSVNTDPSKETLRKSLTSGEITWRCWHEGQGNLPICARWHIKEFPTVFVIDSGGVIRGRGLRGKALELAVAELMNETARTGTNGPFRK